MSQARRTATVVIGSALVVVLGVVGALLLRPGPAPVPHAAIGVTHTERSAVADNPEPAVERALDILGNVTEYGNQHIRAGVPPTRRRRASATGRRSTRASSCSTPRARRR
jgi:hypothetical protein